MAQRKDGIETREKILVAAAEIFAAKGYQNAKVETICRRAKTNIAAINYHFGSKTQLENALLTRFSDPIRERRLQMLNETAAAKTGALSLEEIVRCFVLPVVEFSVEFPNFHKVIMSFFCGIKDKLKLRDHFRAQMKPVIRTYTEELSKALPAVSKEKLTVYTIFMFSTSHLYFDSDMLDTMVESAGLEIDKEAILEDMISYLVAGFRALE